MISEPSFESSSHGRIEQIFLTIPSWVLRYQRQVEIRGTAAVYRDVFKTLDTNVRFLVVTHEEGESHLAEWSKELGVQDRTDVILLPNQTKLSVWAEDTFTICTDRSGHRWILQPVSEEHPSETVIAESIAESTGWGHVPTDHRFQGGNILVGDDFWFLGADSAEGSTLGSRGGRDAAAPGSGVCDGAVHRVMDESRERHLIFSRLPVPGFEDGLQVREIAVNGRPWLET